MTTLRLPLPQYNPFSLYFSSTTDGIVNFVNEHIRVVYTLIITQHRAVLKDIRGDYHQALQLLVKQ